MPNRLSEILSNSRIATVLKTYQHIHGSLLTKGVSFSLIVAAVPLLFLIVTISSFVLDPQLVDLVDQTLYGFLPDEQRANLLAGVERYADREGSLSVVTGFIFLLAVNNLFFDLNRMIATGLGIRHGVARSRLAALLAPLVFVALLYAATLLSGAATWIARLIDLSAAAVNLGAAGISTIVIGLVFLLIFRWVGGRGLRLFPAGVVSLVAAVAWQLILYVAGLTVRVAGTRFVAYGVLAWAVVFLIFMRLIAELLLYGAIILRPYLRDASTGQDNEGIPEVAEA